MARPRKTIWLPVVTNAEKTMLEACAGSARRTRNPSGVSTPKTAPSAQLNAMLITITGNHAEQVAAAVAGHDCHEDAGNEADHGTVQGGKGSFAEGDAPFCTVLPFPEFSPRRVMAIVCAPELRA